MSWQLTFEPKAHFHRNTFAVVQELASDVIIGMSAISGLQVLRFNRERVRCQEEGGRASTDPSAEDDGAHAEKRVKRKVSVDLGWVSGSFQWHGRRQTSTKNTR